MADALWSINERLGGASGIDLKPLGDGWLRDLFDQSMIDSDTISPTDDLDENTDE